MAHKRAKASFTIYRSGNPERTVTISGKSWKEAKAAGTRLLHSMGLGSGKNPKPKKKPRVLVRKKRRTTRRKNLNFGQHMARVRKALTENRKRKKKNPKHGTKAYWKKWAAKMKRARAKNSRKRRK